MIEWSHFSNTNFSVRYSLDGQIFKKLQSHPV